MAISRCFETTKERLEFVFKRKMLNPDESQKYFYTLYPMDMSNKRSDIISGILMFIYDNYPTREFYTQNYRILIEADKCYIQSIHESHPVIVISLYKSDYITMRFVTDTKIGVNDKIRNTYTIKALSELLSTLYQESYTREYLW